MDLVLLVPPTASLEAEPRDELSYVESWDRFGLAWQEALQGTGVLQSTCCAPEHRQSLSQPHFSKEPLCLMKWHQNMLSLQGIRTNPTGTNRTGERTERLARHRITTSLASLFPLLVQSRQPPASPDTVGLSPSQIPSSPFPKAVFSPQKAAVSRGGSGERRPLPAALVSGGFLPTAAEQQQQHLGFTSPSPGAAGDRR